MTAAVFTRALLWSVGLFLLLVVNALFLVFAERKLIGHIHMRPGPMHNGPHGAFQLVFDAMKMVSKEDTVPANADPIFFRLAPAMVALPAYLIYIALPFGPGFVAADFSHGLFFIFAVQALIPIGATVAGWASNNKWSLLGALRSSAMQISYEVPMLLAALGVVVAVGSLRLSDIVNAQAHRPWFLITQPIGFALFFVAMLAEANRTPFDIPEAESELVAGYHTEYSGLKWGLFMMGEYSAMFVGCILVALLYLGGWRLPFVPDLPGLATLILAVKVYLLIALLIWIRGTLPRVRIDQMMEAAWIVLIPVGFVNLLAVALLSYAFPKVFG